MAFREARPFLLLAMVLVGVLACVHWGLALAGMALFSAILYFFRDPERKPAGEGDRVVSAADGRVIVVDEVVEPVLTKRKMKRVAVFLSVLDVHVNRSPVEGVVRGIKHQDGEFLDARTRDVDLRNENQCWLIERADGGVVVVQQIAGLIARRIVGWKVVGDAVGLGERLGMIRFGSRTDVYLPMGCEVVVRVGDCVKGGETVLAQWGKESHSESEEMEK